MIKVILAAMLALLGSHFSLGDDAWPFFPRKQFQLFRGEWAFEVDERFSVMKHLVELGRLSKRFRPYGFVENGNDYVANASLAVVRIWPNPSIYTRLLIGEKIARKGEHFLSVERPRYVIPNVRLIPSAKPAYMLDRYRWAGTNVFDFEFEPNSWLAILDNHAWAAHTIYNQPRPKLIFHRLAGDFVLRLHRFGGFAGVFNSLQSSVQSPLNKPDADAAQNQGHHRDQGAKNSGVSRPLLGVQILLAASLLLAGFYFFIDTFKRSASFHPDAGALRIGLSCLAVGCGALVATFVLAT